LTAFVKPKNVWCIIRKMICVPLDLYPNGAQGFRHSFSAQRPINKKDN
jgi:hypothetical protein